MNKKFKIILSVLLCCFAVWVGALAYQNIYFRSIIPDQIQLSGIGYIDTNFGFGTMLLGEECGVAIFDVSDATLNKIKSRLCKRGQ